MQLCKLCRMLFCPGEHLFAYLDDIFSCAFLNWSPQRTQHRHQCVSLFVSLTLVCHMIASIIVHPMILRRLGIELQHKTASPPLTFDKPSSIVALEIESFALIPSMVKTVAQLFKSVRDWIACATLRPTSSSERTGTEMWLPALQRTLTVRWSVRPTFARCPRIQSPRLHLQASAMQSAAPSEAMQSHPEELLPWQDLVQPDPERMCQLQTLK